jgi:hypothetical protein
LQPVGQVYPGFGRARTRARAGQPSGRFNLLDVFAGVANRQFSCLRAQQQIIVFAINEDHVSCHLGAVFQLDGDQGAVLQVLLIGAQISEFHFGASETGPTRQENDQTQSRHMRESHGANLLRAPEDRGRSPGPGASALRDRWLAIINKGRLF